MATPDDTPIDQTPIDQTPIDPATPAAEPTTGTAPLPVTEPAAADDIWPAVPAKPKRKRRVWPWLVALLVLIVLLVVGFFVADDYAKQYARTYITERIVEVLHLESDDGLTVDIGDGSILLQALSGRLDRIDVSADSVAFGDLVGSATVRAESVPLDASQPVGTLDIVFTVAEEDVAVLAGNLSGLDLDTIELDEPEIVASSSFSVFGFSIPVGIGLTPSVVDGQLAFDTTTITLGDQSFTSDELLGSTFGPIADQLLQQRSFCVAEYLPTALTVVDADVSGDELVIRIDGDGAALDGPDLSTTGTCEG